MIPPRPELDFYKKAFKLFAEKVTDTPIRTPAPRMWQFHRKRQYKEELKRIQRRLMYSVVNADVGASQEFFICCFNYLKRGAPEGIYEGLYGVIGEEKKESVEDGEKVSDSAESESSQIS